MLTIFIPQDRAEGTSHFAIPGRLTLEAQQLELRLAQEALKRLG
jgi:hypothetical protein